MATEYETDYSKFDGNAYLKSFYSDVTTHTLFGNMFVKATQWFHEAFATGNIKGRRLLDIGTGPTIHTVISASAHVDSIFLSDFNQQNREILRSWLDGKLQHNFEDFFKYVVDAEGKGESPVDREMMLREKISGIIQIDLLEEYPLSPSFFPKFDVITSSLCFKAAAHDTATYELIAKRATNLLKDDGHLVLFSVDGPKCYPVGDYIFESFKIAAEKVNDIWKKCGFQIVEWKQEFPQKTGDSDLKSYYLMVGKKVKT